MLLWVGYFLVLTNGFGLGMTLLNVAGVFSPDGQYFGQESLTQSKLKVKEFDAKVEKRTDLT